jgi:hypothetical protein
MATAGTEMVGTETAGTETGAATIRDPRRVQDTLVGRVADRLMDVAPVAALCARPAPRRRDARRQMPLDAARRGGWGRGISGLHEANPWQGISTGRQGELGAAWHEGYMRGARGVRFDGRG